jgi:hypothetical protein
MTFYHAINTSDFMLLNNLEVGKGKIYSPSMANRITGTNGAVSMYQVFNNHQGKEATFERIRVAEFPDTPSREGAIYCFVSEDDANFANKEWWNDSRNIVEVELSDLLAFGIYDSKHLDCIEADWESSARLYFSGEHTAEPFLEAVVCGGMFVPSWQDYNGIAKTLLNI